MVNKAGWGAEWFISQVQCGASFLVHVYICMYMYVYIYVHVHPSHVDYRTRLDKTTHRDTY